MFYWTRELEAFGCERWEATLFVSLMCAWALTEPSLAVMLKCWPAGTFLCPLSICLWIGLFSLWEILWIFCIFWEHSDLVCLLILGTNYSTREWNYLQWSHCVWPSSFINSLDLLEAVELCRLPDSFPCISSLYSSFRGILKHLTWQNVSLSTSVSPTT